MELFTFPTPAQLYLELTCTSHAGSALNYTHLHFSFLLVSPGTALWPSTLFADLAITDIGGGILSKAAGDVKAAQQ